MTPGPALRGDDWADGFGPGGEPVAASDPACAARRLRSADGRRVRHEVRVALAGPDAGRFYTPRPAYGRPGPPSARLRNGNARYAWRPVAPPQFDDYLRFLRTGDDNFLRRAERG